MTETATQQPPTQVDRTIINQAHQIANLNAMLETALAQRNQLAAVVKSQAATLDAATAEIERLKAGQPAAAKASRKRG